MTSEWQALARAKSLADLERWSDAMGALGPALADDTTAGEAYCVQALCFLGLGQTRRSISAAKEALSRLPGEEWPYRLLALGLLRDGRNRDALRAAEEGARLAPDDPHALHVLAVAQLANRNKVEAQATADAVVRANPHEPLAHLTAGVVAEEHKRFGQAEAAYREALRLDPVESDAAIRLGDVLRRGGRHEEAVDAYLAAGRADPTSPAARRGLAKVGLPIVGVGLALKLTLGAGVRVLIVDRISSPFAWGVLAVGALAIVGAVVTVLRRSGARHLPPEVWRGLRRERIDAVCAWILAIGVASTVIAVWAAFVPASGGGGWPVVAGFGLLAVAAFAGTRRFASAGSTPRVLLDLRWAPFLVRRMFVR